MTKDESAPQHAPALAAAIDRRDLSVREGVDAAIARIERLNPRLDAVVDRRFAAARAEADALDRARPERPGPFRAAPFLLEDVNLCSSALPTRFASRCFADAKPKGGKARSCGAGAGGLAILGMTDTPEFAGDFTTEPLV